MRLERFEITPGTVNTFETVKLSLKGLKDEQIYVFKGLEVVYPINDTPATITLQEVELTDKLPTDIRGIDDSNTVIYGSREFVVGATDTSRNVLENPAKIQPISPRKSNDDDFWIGVKATGRTAVGVIKGIVYYYIKKGNKGDIADLKDQ